MERCWECESEVALTIKVMLPIPNHGRLTVALCPACHRNVFTPLVTELIDVGHAGSSAGVTGLTTGPAVLQ
jgi:hypothetical protein